MTTKNSDKMATWPVSKLVFSMSIPAVISMLIQAMYNIVDTMYVSQLGGDALFAIGLVFPLQMVGLSIALGGGAGTATLISRRLGQKNGEEANKVASTGIVLTILHYAVCVALGLFASKPFLRLFTSNATVIEMGFVYLSTVLCISVGQHFSIYFERILQGTGNMIAPMIAQLIGAITNIVLDPILIFGYFGFPALGIYGAALATVIGQILGCLFVTIIIFTKEHDVQFSFKGFKMEAQRVRDIYQVGLPVMIMNAIGSVTTTALNAILVGFSEAAVTALTLYFKIQSFVFMPVFGFNQGTTPILAYNYGAQNLKRYKKTVQIYLTVALVVMGIGTLIFWLGTDQLLGIFNASGEILAMGEPCLRIISLSFMIAACTIIMTTVLQSVGDGFSAMMMSLCRQLIFLIPLAFVLSKWLGVNGVWASYPLAELLVVCVFLPITVKRIKKSFSSEGVK